MPSSRKKNPRRQAFLSLAGQIECQLREAYGRKYDAGALTQSTLAKRLGVNRSAIHHRLMGLTNMTVATIADMVWALDYDITINIYDPAAKRDGSNNQIGRSEPVQATNSALNRQNYEHKERASARNAYAAPGYSNRSRGILESVK